MYYFHNTLPIRLCVYIYTLHTGSSPDLLSAMATSGTWGNLRLMGKLLQTRAGGDHSRLPEPVLDSGLEKAIACLQGSVLDSGLKDGIV